VTPISKIVTGGTFHGQIIDVTDGDVSTTGSCCSH